MQYLNSAKRTFENQIRALQNLHSSLNDSFSKACDLLLACQGKVVVCGMGKSGHIGHKIAATLASTGTPSFFMHPAEANHGDFGMLAKGDVIIAISNSGETSELIGLIPSFKRLQIPLIAITNKPESTLAKLSHVPLTLGVKTEACALGLAPTTSTTASLVLGDAIAIALLEAKGFTKEDFALSHPGGSLGRRLLLQVKDLMVTGENLPLVKNSANIKQALLEVSAKGLGLTGIVDDKGKMLGVFTDGDLRRALDQKVDIHQTLITNVMTKGGIIMGPNEMAVDALTIMQEKRISSIIVTDPNNNPIGALNMYMLLNAGVM